MDDEREVHRGRVQAKVEHALGKVERGDARLLVEIDERHDELVHADLVIGHGEGILEPDAHVVRVQHGVHRRLADTGLAEREHVGQRAHDDVEVAVEHLHAADGLFGVCKAVLAVLFDDQRAGHVLFEEFLAADRACAGAAAAVRCGERLMQVTVDAVKAHVTGTDDAHDGVEVRAVVIAQAARIVNDLRDLEDVLVENTDGVRVRQHQSRGVGADGGAQRVEVDAAVHAGRDVDDLEAAHRGGRGVRAVGGVGHDDLRARGIAAVGVIGLDEQNAGELTVRARRGLERDSVHAEDLAKLRA